MSNNDEKTSSDSGLLKEYEMNVDMWKHYDDLRQDKNKTFLTANSILAAAVGFVLKNQQSEFGSNVVALLISLVGFLACLLWFLLLSRSTVYIEFHSRLGIYYCQDVVPGVFTPFGGV